MYNMGIGGGPALNRSVIASLGAAGIQPLTPLDPANASQPMKLAVSTMRRVRPAYGNGIILQVRDSANAGPYSLSFKSDGTNDADPAVWSLRGNGVDFTCNSLRDQSGNAIDFSSASRPKLIFPNAPTSYDNPYLDFTANAMNLITAAGFLDIGGTANLTCFVVHKRLGFGSVSNPMPRPGVASSSVVSNLLAGFGSSTILVHTPTTANDPIGGVSECVYNKPKILSLDESTPSASNGWEVTWFNQDGANVSGGGDSRMHWSGRKHNIASSTAQRLVLGAGTAGNGAFNGHIAELIVFQSATPMTNTECRRIALFLNNYYSGQNTFWDLRFWIAATGQSNMANQFVDSGSGDGTAGSNSIARMFVPTLATLMGKHAGRFTVGISNRTCVGGTGMLKRPNVGDPDRLSYWRDEDTDGPGTLTLGMLLGSTSVANGGAGYVVGDILPIVGGTQTGLAATASLRVTAVSGGVITAVTPEVIGNYSVLPSNPVSVTGGSGTGATFTATWAGGLTPSMDALEEPQYQYLCILHAQGEEDAHTITTGMPRKQTWCTQSLHHFDYIRQHFGQPNAPVVVQPLAGYASDVVNINDMVRLQRYTMSQGNNIYIAADTGHLACGSSNNYRAHLGGLGAGSYDPTTGGAEDGYQRAARQNAKAMAKALGADVIWRGPEATAATRSGSTTIDVTITYPVGCSGTDFSTPSGQYGGWRAYNAGGNLAISSVARLNATTVRITFSSTLPAGDITVVYEPDFASGSVVGVNVRNQIVDNNATEAMPLATSDYLIAA